MRLTCVCVCAVVHTDLPGQQHRDGGRGEDILAGPNHLPSHLDFLFLHVSLLPEDQMAGKTHAACVHALHIYDIICVCVECICPSVPHSLSW